MVDFYSILEVPKDASLDDIKKAYRKLALKYHPDKSDGHKDKFQQVQEAYETLSNPDKKHAYDNPHQGFDNHFPFHFNSFFNNNNNGHHPTHRKKSDHQYDINITLKDVYFGLLKKIKVTREKPCQSCVVICQHCNGHGALAQRMQLGPFTQIIEHTCQHCKGNGYTHSASFCGQCELGTLKEDKIIELVIPKATDNGHVFIYDGWGEQAHKPNEHSGNLVIKILVQDHPIFRRNKLDLFMNIDISLVDSIVGTNITIPHFKEEFTLHTRGFGVINPSKQYTIFGKGLEDSNGTTGNLHIQFTVQYPNKVLIESDCNALRNTFRLVNME